MMMPPPMVMMVVAMMTVVMMARPCGKGKAAKQAEYGQH